jgi:hypothetical protein
MNQRLPRIAIVGLFQGGKSLLINAALGGSFVPVGKFGLRTTPCQIRCRYGEIHRAVAHKEGCAPRAMSIRAVSAFVEALGPDERLLSMEFFNCHPLLKKVELTDTPGIDYSEGDNESALAAAREADAVVLVIQQSLPTAAMSFDKLIECLKDKPWGMVLNCGRAGPHLDHPDSPASIEVEEHSLRQLIEVGLNEPVFSQRMSARTLSYYAAEQFGAEKTLSLSDEHLEDLALDETSIRQWRDNLLLLGRHWFEERLERARQRVLDALRAQEWVDPKVKFESETMRFECSVGFDGYRYKVTGSFRIDQMKRHERLVIHDFSCHDEWVTEWLQANPEWLTWKFA